eukprot:11256848-Alexandrium_andersonii.AAC.1
MKHASGHQKTQTGSKVHRLPLGPPRCLAGRGLARCPRLSPVVPGRPRSSPVVPDCPRLYPIVPDCPRLSPIVPDSRPLRCIDGA